MGSYLVTLELFYLDENFWPLLPSHRKMISDFLITGTIEMYAIAEDRSKGWIVFNTETQEEVVRLLENFVIRDYFSYEISPLFILNNAMSLWPKMHLN